MVGNHNLGIYVARNRIHFAGFLLWRATAFALGLPGLDAEPRSGASRPGWASDTRRKGTRAPGPRRAVRATITNKLQALLLLLLLLLFLIFCLLYFVAFPFLHMTAAAVGQ